jgi:putative oxygen-independent coproporphyrinogen III oxidase
MEDQKIMQDQNVIRNELGLYIHIPFCAKKCDYCDFLSGPASEEQIKAYFDALLAEIESYQGLTQPYIVPTLFIGGGTPSVVHPSYIEATLNKISQVFQIDRSNLEATIEINPGTVTREKLEAYKKCGINRISFGLQSARNEELKLLGRIHTYEQFEQNYKLARELGFENINIDLMSALPGQTLDSWEATLNKIIALNPEHISAYSLIIEEGTPFYNRYGEGSKEADNLPDEETDRIIYHRTKEILQNNGYRRYEISNYAKPGYECRHNLSYWIGTEYLGIGLGAASLLDGRRFSNLQDREQYVRLCISEALSIRCDDRLLSQEERMEEFMFLGLRVCSGISKLEFINRFGTAIETIYGPILQSLKEKKLIEIKQDNIKLTEYGIDVSNQVLAEFLLS